MNNIVVCTNLSGKEPDKQVGVHSMMTSENLGGIMVSTLNVRGAGLNPDLGAIVLIFITPITLVP